MKAQIAMFLAATLVSLAVTLVYVIRIARGPTVFDRLLGLNGFGLSTTLVLMLTGVLYERLDMFVDLSLAYALLSFVGSLGAARYFDRTGPHG